MKISVDVPGKLYLAGEYAVVYGGWSVMVPTRKRVRVTAESSSSFMYASTTFNPFDPYAIDNMYVRDAIAVAHAYVSKQSLRPYALRVDSPLQLDGHPKLGFGSSGAVSVGVLDAVLRFHGHDADPLTLYKLAVLAQHKNHPYSSFGDVAVSAFNHAMVYRRFDLAVLKQGLRGTVRDIVGRPWSGLMITPFTMPDVPWTIVHTGDAADSQAMVKAVHAYRYTPAFFRFKARSDKLVEDYVRHPRRMMVVIRALHDNLMALQDITGVTLFTDAMKAIEKRLRTLPVAIKFSGAGGGDCVIIACQSASDKSHVTSALVEDYRVLDDFF